MSDSTVPSSTAPVIGVVAIGRNEGERLRSCLESVKNGVAAVVYVDSGSTDGSMDLARSLGVETISLDLSLPFTAARSRNAGAKKLFEIKADIEFIQFVDGDCEVVDGWLGRAVQEMRGAGAENLAIVCGRRRERYPDASLYNRLIDMEWNTPVGEAEACGGDALIRAAAFKQVGGYDETLIAGEEPEMCWRLRQQSGGGWRILRIDAEMTLHDAQMSRFSQWWKRNVRSGHAYAEGHAMHGHVDGYCGFALRSIVQWALVLPLVMFGLAWFTWGASFLLLGLYIVLWARIRAYRMNQHNDASADASLYANHCIAGKFAQLQGAVKFWFNRLLGRRTRLIEYKKPEAATTVGPAVANGGGA